MYWLITIFTDICKYIYHYSTTTEKMNGLRNGICLSLQISYTALRMFIKIASDVKNRKTLSISNVAAMSAQVQCHTCESTIRAFYFLYVFVSTPYLIYPWKVFNRLAFYVNRYRKCTEHVLPLSQLQTQVTLEGQNLKGSISSKPLEGFYRS